MKAPLSKKVKALFNSPEDSQILLKAIKALNGKHISTETTIKGKKIVLIEVR